MKDTCVCVNEVRQMSVYRRKYRTLMYDKLKDNLRKLRRLRKGYLVFLVAVVIIIAVHIRQHLISDATEQLIKIGNITINSSHRSKHLPSKGKYLVLYYNVPSFIKDFRSYALSCDFKTCEWNNCEFTYDSRSANISDVVIFDGIYMPMPKKLKFKRPNGQVWIFAEFEPPCRYHIGNDWWFKGNYKYNWTMTYDSLSADIHLPYGAIIKRPNRIRRNYEEIARSKANMSLIIASHCYTLSKRQRYVNQLRKFMDVKILGKCSGTSWNCGKHFEHNDTCFEIVNSYKFFLAFENSFCEQYFTEKFFENFNYNSIMVTRGGLPGNAKQMFPAGSFISSDDFNSAKDLALYLKGISISDYAKMLERKDQFYSIGFKGVFQRALCDICRRMNFQEKYKQTISDINKWVNRGTYCIQPSEVKDTN